MSRQESESSLEDVTLDVSSLAVTAKSLPLILHEKPARARTRARTHTRAHTHVCITRQSNFLIFKM